MGGGGTARYALDVDVAAATVTVGTAVELEDTTISLTGVAWADRPVLGDVLVQCSAHGAPAAATISCPDPVDPSSVVVSLAEPMRRIAPGQSVVFYEADEILGGGIVQRR